METVKISTDHFAQLFKASFDKFFQGLHRYAFTLLKDHEKANDVVQAIFTKWWERQTPLQSTEEAKAYLYTAVYRHCLNVIRDDKVKLAHSASYVHQIADSNGFFENNSVEELQTLIQAAIDSLPGQCQLIFTKSRFEQKRYAEIAEEMNLSIKTIEAQMGKALKILREKLRDYL